jgi:hypothetical protein
VYCRRSCRQRAFEARRRLGELAWGEQRLIELRERQDDLQVAVAGLVDLVGELRADVEDERPWTDDERKDVVDRLGALVADLKV